MNKHFLAGSVRGDGRDHAILQLQREGSTRGLSPPDFGFENLLNGLDHPAFGITDCLPDYLGMGGVIGVDALIAPPAHNHLKTLHIAIDAEGKS
ncbi:hypothetical protein D9M69_602560 [compost metagenome]